MALCIEGTILPHGNHGTSPQYQCCFGHVFGQVGKRPARHALAQPGGALPANDANVDALEIQLSEGLGMPVALAVAPGASSGSLTIRFASLDQLDWLCAKLGQG